MEQKFIIINTLGREQAEIYATTPKEAKSIYTNVPHCRDASLYYL